MSTAVSGSAALALPAWWRQYAYARHALEQHEYAEAESVLQTLCESQPDRAEPLALLAHLHRTQSRWQAGYELAQAALAAPRPTDGSDQFEPHAWLELPLETIAICAWHLQAPAPPPTEDDTADTPPPATPPGASLSAAEQLALRHAGRFAAEQLVHHRAVSNHQRTRAVRHAGWYLDQLPWAWQRRVKVPRDIYRADESLSTPSLVREVDGDGYLLLARLVTYDIYPDGRFVARDRQQVRNNNAITLLDADLQPRGWSRLDDTLLREQSPVPSDRINVYGIEDLRLVWWRDAWWFTAMSWHFTPHRQPGVVLGRLEVDANGGRVTHLLPLTTANARTIEKNWLPVVHRERDELLLLYNAEPLTILRPDLETGVCAPLQSDPAPLSLDSYRGSAAPIPWHDGYLYLVHAVGYELGHTVYQHRLVELDADLRLRRLSAPFMLRQRGIEYCTGLTVSHDGTHLLFSHSWMDAEAWLSAVPCAAVDALLQPWEVLAAHARPSASAAIPPSPALPDWWHTYRDTLHDALQGDTALAMRALEELAEAQPARAEPHYHLARLTRQRATASDDTSAAAYPHASRAIAASFDPPDDGSDALEPDAWQVGPLHELAISAWYADAHEIGRSAADLLIHDRAATPLQRQRGVEHASWYLSPLPVTTSTQLVVPDHLLRATQAPANGALATLDDGSYLLLQRLVNYTYDHLRTATARNPEERIDSHYLKARVISSPADAGAHTLLISDWQHVDTSILNNLAPLDPEFLHDAGLEDMRLVRWQGAWWFSACTSQLAAGRDQGNDVVLGRLVARPDAWHVEHLVPLQLPGANAIEKNWLPFVDTNGELRLLYGCEPLTVLAVDPSTGLCERIHCQQQPIAMDRYRNSAGPLPWGAGYLLVIHEVASFDEETVYQHRFVEFDADWQVTRLSTPFYLRQRGIEYLLGITYNHAGDHLLLHHSVMDAEAWLSHIPITTVDDLLLPVEDLLSE